MQVIDTDLPEVKRVVLTAHRDARGFFVERFKASALGGFGSFVQDNHSRSIPGVIRGLHFQYGAPQGKLVGVTSGRILDVALDVRPHSPNFGRHVSAELTPEGALLWVPPGFAHGFCVLGGEPADVVYKLTAEFNPATEGGVRYDTVPWPIANPILSDRDRQLPMLADAKENLKQWFPA